MFFSITIDGFFSYGNLVNIVYHSIFVGLLVIAMSICLISGQMDLSLESTVGLTAVIGAWLATYETYPSGSGLGLSVFIVVPIMLLLGGTIGLLNGVTVTKLKINSFIVTLAGYVAYRGVAILVTNGASITGISDAYKTLDRITIYKIPIVVCVVIFLYIFWHLILRKSRFGRYIYAVGNNVEAAKKFGINSDAVIIKVFIIGGILAALCGWFMSAKINGSTSNTGKGLIFDVFAAAVIGGISLKGGEGNLLTTLGGVLILSSIRSALNIAAIPVFYVQILRGGLIAFAVIIDSLKNKFWQRNE